MPSSCPQMAIIFSEEDLKDVKPPCVIQSFINHNAVLYKVFVVGESYTVVERPSLKNFPAGPAGEDREKERVKGLFTATLVKVYKTFSFSRLRSERPHKVFI